MTRPGNCGGVSSQAWTRDRWTASNYCAWVEVGQTREERASRLAECPVVWRDAVTAHVRCAFAARAEARKRQEAKAREAAKARERKG